MLQVRYKQNRYGRKSNFHTHNQITHAHNMCGFRMGDFSFPPNFSLDEKLVTQVHLLSQHIGSWVRLITLRVAAYFLCHRTRRCKRSFCLSCSGDTGLRQTSARLNEIISSISATKYKQCSSVDLDFLQIMYRSGSLWNT